MTDVELDAWIKEVRGRCERASEGPWHIGHVSERGGICELADIDSGDGCLVAQVEWRRDQSFICSSRTDLPQALKIIAELRDKNRTLSGQCWDYPRLESDWEEEQEVRQRYGAALERVVDMTMTAPLLTDAVIQACREALNPKEDADD